MVMLLVEGGEKIQRHRTWNKYALSEATSTHKLQLMLETLLKTTLDHHREKGVDSTNMCASRTKLLRFLIVVHCFIIIKYSIHFNH